MVSNLTCNKFNALYRQARLHENCLNAFLSVAADYEKLPQDLQDKFDTPFGIDLNISEFLRTQFDIDITQLPEEQSSRIVNDLCTGVVSKGNPLLDIKDHDLIADRISEYSELSKKIREAFNLSLRFRQAPYEVITDASNHTVDTMTSPIYDEKGDTLENITMQVDWFRDVIETSKLARASGCKSPEETVKFTCRSSTYSAEVKNVYITIFDGTEAIGSIEAQTVSCDPKAAKGRAKQKLINQHIRNSYLVNDTEAYSDELYDSMMHLTNLSSRKVQEVNSALFSGEYSQAESLTNQFYLPDTGGRYVSMHITDVEFNADLKTEFINIIETLRMVFEDVGMYHERVFARCGGLKNQSEREMFADTETVRLARNSIKETLFVDGISAIVCQDKNTWWQNDLKNFKPCHEHFDCKTSVLVYDNPSYEEAELTLLCKNEFVELKTIIGDFMPRALESIFTPTSNQIAFQK